MSVGIDSDHIGFSTDHVSAELFDLQRPIYRLKLINVKCSL